jgi:hypothetical protein
VTAVSCSSRGGYGESFADLLQLPAPYPAATKRLCKLKKVSPQPPIASAGAWRAERPTSWPHGPPAPRRCIAPRPAPLFAGKQVPRRFRQVVPSEGTFFPSRLRSGGQEFESLRARQLAHCRHNCFVQSDGELLPRPARRGSAVEARTVFTAAHAVTDVEYYVRRRASAVRHGSHASLHE